MRLWLLNLVPYRLRTRGPFRRYFWQAEDIERTYRSAARLADDFGWNDSDDEMPKWLTLDPASYRGSGVMSRRRKGSS